MIFCHWKGAHMHIRQLSLMVFMLFTPLIARQEKLYIANISEAVPVSVSTGKETVLLPAESYVVLDALQLPQEVTVTPDIKKGGDLPPKIFTIPTNWKSKDVLIKTGYFAKKDDRPFWKKLIFGNKISYSFASSINPYDYQNNKDLTEELKGLKQISQATSPFQSLRKEMVNSIQTFKNEVDAALPENKPAVAQKYFQYMTQTILDRYGQLSPADIEQLKQDYVTLLGNIQKNHLPEALKAKFQACLDLKKQYEQEELHAKLKTALSNFSYDDLKKIHENLLSRILLPAAGNMLDYYRNQLQSQAPQEPFVQMIMGIEFSLYAGTDKESLIELIATLIDQNYIDKIEDPVSQKIFDTIKSSNKPVIIDCFGTYCPPCKMMKPIFEKVSHEYQNDYTFLEVDIQQAPLFAQTYSIQAVPTFLFIKDNQVIDQHAGALPEAAFRKKIAEVFNA